MSTNEDLGKLATATVSTNFRELAYCLVKPYKIVILRVSLFEVSADMREGLQVNRTKMALWTDSKGPLAFIISGGWWVISAHIEQLEHP